MKTNAQILLVLLVVLTSSSFAQDGIDSNIKPGKKFYPNLDSVTLKQNLNITSVIPGKPDSAVFPFQSHLPARLLNKHEGVAIENTNTHLFRFNMPVAKPKANSKILIAKFDPIFPYSYNMPVLKIGEALK